MTYLEREKTYIAVFDGLNWQQSGFGLSESVSGPYEPCVACDCRVWFMTTLLQSVDFDCKMIHSCCLLGYHVDIG